MSGYQMAQQLGFVVPDMATAMDKYGAAAISGTTKPSCWAIL